MSKKLIASKKLEILSKLTEPEASQIAVAKVFFVSSKIIYNVIVDHKLITKLVEYELPEKDCTSKWI